MIRTGNYVTRQIAWISPILAVGSFAALLIGINVFGVIPPERVTFWDFLHIGFEVEAFLLGKDWRTTPAGKAGMFLGGLFLLIEVFRIVSLSAHPGIQ